jgi:MoxR-like ATPase
MGLAADAGTIDRSVNCAGTLARMDEQPHRFDDVGSVRTGLRDVDYLADEGIAGVVYLADRLGKPVLVEGPAGTGKTQLAKSVAEMTGSRLIRLQCYEGLDESKALYEWNYKKQLLRIQAQNVVEAGHPAPEGSSRETTSWTDIEEDIFGEEFLLTRPLLEAIRAEEPVVLLIDEVDRVEVETEALLLEILSEYQVSIPEMGTVVAKQIPLVFLTSNNTRELSEALKRRCLYLHVDYPDLEREKLIVTTKVEGVSENLADQIARVVRSLRQLDLKKAPSVSETIDWARTLVLLGIQTIDAKVATDTLNILLKYRSDIAKAEKELATNAPGAGA